MISGLSEAAELGKLPRRSVVDGALDVIVIDNQRHATRVANAAYASCFRIGNDS